MADTKYMVIGDVEELLDDKGNVIGRLVTDKAGEQFKVKKGQGGKLADRWEELDNGIGKAFEFTMGIFKPPGKTEGYPFVADFIEVKDALKIKAIEEVAEAMPAGRDLTRVSIERQVSLKCATEIEVANIGTGNTPEYGSILKLADEFYNWLKEVQGETKTSIAPKSESVEEANKPETRQGSGEAAREDSDLSWEAIRGKINHLMKAKHPQYTVDKMTGRIAELGGEGKTIKDAYESLSDGNKLGFGCQIEEDLKTLTKEE